MRYKCNTAIILAGGKSKRMGFDKINIPYKDGRILDYQIDVLKNIFDEIIVVSNNLKYYHDENIKIVSDEFKDRGPLAGLHVGLKHATSKFCYLIACDMPFINTDYIYWLKKKLVNFRGDVIAFKNKNFIEPFNAIYRQKIYKKIEKSIIKSEVFSMQEFIKKIKYEFAYDKVIQKSNMFSNLNTVEDIKICLGDNEFERINSGKEFN